MRIDLAEFVAEGNVGVSDGDRALNGVLQRFKHRFALVGGNDAKHLAGHSPSDAKRRFEGGPVDGRHRPPSEGCAQLHLSLPNVDCINGSREECSARHKEYSLLLAATNAPSPEND